MASAKFLLSFTLLAVSSQCILGQILSGDCACVTSDGVAVWDRREWFHQYPAAFEKVEKV